MFVALSLPGCSCACCSMLDAFSRAVASVAQHSTARFSSLLTSAAVDMLHLPLPYSQKLHSPTWARIQQVQWTSPCNRPGQHRIKLSVQPCLQSLGHIHRHVEQCIWRALQQFSSLAWLLPTLSVRECMTVRSCRHFSSTGMVACSSNVHGDGNAERLTCMQQWLLCCCRTDSPCVSSSHWDVSAPAHGLTHAWDPPEAGRRKDMCSQGAHSADKLHACFGSATTAAS